MGVNLDNLFNDKQASQEGNSTVQDLVVSPKSKVQGTVKEDTSHKAIYDQYQQLLYAIDISGSMSSPLPSKSIADYEWPAEPLRSYIPKFFINEEGLVPEEEELLKLLVEADDVMIKHAIIKIGPERYNIYQNYAIRQSKMDLVKKAVKDLVDRRYTKYPDARVILMPFDAEANIVAATWDDIKFKLQGLQPNGGTNIFKAVKTALEYFEKYPSPVGLNHIVLVTDGDDWRAVEVETLLEKMVELGVVLDYIYIIANIAKGNETAVAKMFKKICKELRGDYVEVDSETMFEQKLFQASTRLCLPPGVD